MSDLSGEDQFLLKSLKNLAIGGEVGPDDFERDQAIDLDVFCLVDGSHAAFAQFFQDFITRAEKLVFTEERSGGSTNTDGWPVASRCAGRRRNSNGRSVRDRRFT